MLKTKMRTQKNFSLIKQSNMEPLRRYKICRKLLSREKKHEVLTNRVGKITTNIKKIPSGRIFELLGCSKQRLQQKSLVDE